MLGYNRCPSYPNSTFAVFSAPEVTLGAKATSLFENMRVVSPSFWKWWRMLGNLLRATMNSTVKAHAWLGNWVRTLAIIVWSTKTTTTRTEIIIILRTGNENAFETFSHVFNSPITLWFLCVSVVVEKIKFRNVISKQI